MMLTAGIGAGETGAAGVTIGGEVLVKVVLGNKVAGATEVVVVAV